MILKAVLLTIALLLAFMVPAIMMPAFASCDCRCIDGESQPVCTSSLEVPPICSRQDCPVSPSMTPIGPVNPSVGSGQCHTVQVYNRRTGRYDTRPLCR